MPYHLICERLRMARLDDCSILQPEHLVENRLGQMHDLINIQNFRSHNFACKSSQAMCHATKGGLACPSLRQTQVSGGTRYPTTLEDQWFWMSSQVSMYFRLYTAMTLRIGHTYGKPLLDKLNKVSIRVVKDLKWLYELSTWCPQPWALGQELLGKKSRLPERAGVYDS
jgi:hypothetical protein